MKKPTYKENLSAINVAQHLDLLEQNKQDFVYSFSNYWCKIETENSIIKFVSSTMSLKTFAAFAKIKNDLKNWTANEQPKVCSNSVSYYQHNVREEKHKYILNIDLKSAYATILYTTGYISQKTFNYISKLKKTERLACVGMFAKKKNIIDFYNGEAIKYRSEVSEFSDYFFYCVQKTDEIINGLQSVLKERYLFTWVDGIYFTLQYNDEYYVNELQKQIDTYFQKFGLNYHCLVLENYTCENREKNHFITFDKTENNNTKNKVFNLPNKYLMEQTKFLNYYLSLNSEDFNN